MFRPESKEVYENGGYQTSGVDMVVTAERVILLDTQPVLSDTLLDQISHNESSIPVGMSAEAYLEVMVCDYSVSEGGRGGEGGGRWRLWYVTTVLVREGGRGGEGGGRCLSGGYGK